MFRLHLFTRICLLKLVPSVKCPFLLFTQVWPLLQQPMGDPALADTCEKPEQNKKKQERKRKVLLYQTYLSGLSTDKKWCLTKPGNLWCFNSRKSRVEASLIHLKLPEFLPGVVFNLTQGTPWNNLHNQPKSKEGKNWEAKAITNLNCPYLPWFLNFICEMGTSPLPHYYI